MKSKDFRWGWPNGLEVEASAKKLMLFRTPVTTNRGAGHSCWLEGQWGGAKGCPTLDIGMLGCWRSAFPCILRTTQFSLCSSSRWKPWPPSQMRRVLCRGQHVDFGASGGPTLAIVSPSYLRNSNCTCSRRLRG